MTKGKLQTKKSEPKNKPSWLKFNEKDVEAIVVKLSKQGLTSEKIGLVLRDTYGIPTTKILGKKITQILRENKIEENADLKNLEKKKEQIINHLEKNKQDKRTKRALTIINARISKLKKYKER